MPFRFPLAAVLLVREHAETREERALKKIQIELARTARQVDALDAAMIRAHDVRERALREPIPSFQLQDYQREVDEAAEKKKVLLVQLQILRRDLGRQMKVYQAAHRDREAVTGMLKEQREAYDEEQAREQQKQIDDLFMARRHRS